MKKILLLIIAIAWTSSSCEKDDICDENTPTTPALIVNFYSIDNPTVAKTVTNLAIIGDGLSTYILTNGASTIKVPLRTTADSVSYQFILDYNNANTALVNEDLLQFNYTRSNVFISRACGYKTVFSLDSTNPYVLSDVATADGLWIQEIIVSQPNITNENEVHLKILF